MPDMDGFETAALIHSRKRSAHTPIIFVTAYMDEFHTAQGYAQGAVDYILTPCRTRDSPHQGQGLRRSVPHDPAGANAGEEPHRPGRRARPATAAEEAGRRSAFLSEVARGVDGLDGTRLSRRRPGAPAVAAPGRCGNRPPGRSCRRRGPDPLGMVRLRAGAPLSISRSTGPVSIRCCARPAARWHQAKRRSCRPRSFQLQRLLKPPCHSRARRAWREWSAYTLRHIGVFPMVARGKIVGVVLLARGGEPPSL